MSDSAYHAIRPYLPPARFDRSFANPSLPPVYSSHLTEELLHPLHSRPPCTPSEAHVRLTIASIRLSTAVRSRTLLPFEEWRYLCVPTPLLVRSVPDVLSRASIGAASPPAECRRLLVLHAVAFSLQTLPALDPELWTADQSSVLAMYVHATRTDYTDPSVPTE